MSVITGTVSAGVMLTTAGTYASPLTVAGTGYVDDIGSGDAIYGSNTQAWTVVNYGRVIAEGGIGVDLQGGGTVSNKVNGRISGVRFGVYFHTVGTLNNAGAVYGNTEGVRLHSGGAVVNQDGGKITGFNFAIYAQRGALAAVTNAGYITNTGFAAAVELAGGGVVINQDGGTIAGKFDGVDAVYAVATVTNNGVITGSGGAYGVRLLAGGTVADAGTIAGAGGTAVSFGGAGDNRLILYPSYALNGKVVGSTTAGATNTLELAAGPTAGILSGLGTEFLDFGRVQVDLGANWTLTGSNTFGSGATLSNAGTIIASTGTLTCGADSLFNSGLVTGRVILMGGGYLANAAGGVVQGGFAGVDIYGAAGTITNAGTIGATGTHGAGIRLRAGGSVDNTAVAGLILGYYGIDVQLVAGTLINAGTIASNGEGGCGLKLRAGGIVGNTGTIIATGSFGYGVAFAAGGTLSNTAVTGLIQGGDAGVAIYGGSGFLTNAGTIASTGKFGAGVLIDNGGTVVDSGTIVGGAGLAILFEGTGSNRLVLEPGYALGGVAAGSVSGSNTLELAAGTAAGTLSGLGTEFINFGTVTVDAGAQWLLAGNNTIAGGVTLNNLGILIGGGTLISKGVVYGNVSLAGAYLLNVGTITTSTSGDAVDGIGNHVTVINSGKVFAAGPESGAIYLKSGDVVTNLAGGLIVGDYFGVRLLAFTGTFTNYGTILSTGTATSGSTAVILIGGSATNASGGLIEGGAGLILAGAGTIINDGTILGDANFGPAVFLQEGGVDNTSRGLIAGHDGVSFGGTLVNAGTVLGTGGVGAVMYSGIAINTSTGLISGAFIGFEDDYVIPSAFVNFGTVVGGGFVGVYMETTCSITNASSGLIEGPSGIYIRGANNVPATVVNAGVITATGGEGIGVDIMLRNGATITNTGMIIADGMTGVGVDMPFGGTVESSGMIAALSGTAIVLGGSTANRLVLDPGYSLVGEVIGSTAAGASNTLELAIGTGAGTMAGIGTEFINFGAVTVDAGAKWMLTGSNTVGNDVVLTVGGTLIDDGSLLVSPSGMVNGTATVADGGSLEFQGAVGNGTGIVFGGGGTLVIDDLATIQNGSQHQDFQAAIGGLIDGDRLLIATTSLGAFTEITNATPGPFNGGTTPLYLTTSGGEPVATLTLDGNYAGDAFGVSLPAGGVQTVGLQIDRADDFAGSGLVDIPFQSAGNAEVIFAAMNNGTFASFGIATGGLGTLSAVGHGDVNGDGFSDIVVQDPNSSQVYFGEEDGTGNGNPNWVLGPLVPGFTAVGIGDIEGADRDDVVLQNASGQIEDYDTRDDYLVSIAAIPGWNVVGVGDVNGDGYADIVIQDRNSGDATYGDIDYINMVGGRFSGFVSVASTPGWDVKAVADLTGDGYADLVIENPSADDPILSADMHGGTFNGWRIAAPALTPDYVVADTADVLNNGHADLIVQQQSTGSTYYAEEGASGFAQWGVVVTGIGTSYRVI